MGMLRDVSRAGCLAVQRAAVDGLAVLLPTECAGCGKPDQSLCYACRGALAPNVREWTVQTDHEHDALSTPLPVYSSLDYAGSVRRILLAYKDGGRTDVAKWLAPALRAGVAACIAGESDTNSAVEPSAIEIVAIPSSRNAWARRGYYPVGLLVRRANLVSAPVLRHVRQPGDQAVLGLAARWGNLHDSLRAAGGHLGGRTFLLVDDIVTTGATLWEARRALEATGARVVGAATVAHTQRLHPARTDSKTQPINR